jgi:hypothetical protein
MKSFEDFLNETVIKFDPSKIDWNSRDTAQKIEDSFEDVMVSDLAEVFGRENVNSLRIILDEAGPSVQYIILGDEQELFNRHERDEKYFDPHLNLKAFKYNAMVIEKSIEHFNISEEEVDKMEVDKKSLTVEISVHFTMDEFLNRYKEKIPNEIISLLGIQKYKL